MNTSIHSKTTCRGFKSFCPCSKRNGLNTAFKPFPFVFLAFSRVFFSFLSLGFRAKMVEIVT